MKKPNKYKKPKSPKTLWLMIIVIVISSIVLVVNLVAVMLYKPDEVAKSKFEEMARDYYENYFWARITDKSVLADYNPRGHRVSLATLLVYDGAKNATNSYYFEKFDCKTSSTIARLVPVEPYGQKDYTLELTYSCNF